MCNKQRFNHSLQCGGRGHILNSLNMKLIPSMRNVPDIPVAVFQFVNYEVFTPLWGLSF